MTRGGWKALAVLGGVLTLAPVLGVLGTVIGLAVSFDAVSHADPSEKAATLSQGISLAMWSTVIGIAMFPIGATLFGVSLWQILRRRPAQPE